MARVWADVLGLDRVGVTDNFFALGGDSILSVQVVARARRHGLYLSTKDLFHARTIAELATVVTVDPGVEDRAEVTGPAPLTPIQRWFFAADRTNPAHFTMSHHTELATEPDLPALRTALDALIAHHDALRLRFHHEGAEWRQVHVPHEPVDVLDVHEVPGPDDPAVTEPADAVHAGFDLAAGPLLRALLYRFADGSNSRLLLGSGYLLGALFAAMALLAPTANTTIVTHQLLLIPDELRGRLSGTLNVAVGAAGALGPALGGLLAETTTPTTAVLVTAAGRTAAALAATVNRTLRHYPERKETPSANTWTPTDTVSRCVFSPMLVNRVTPYRDLPQRHSWIDRTGGER